jgi:hypothetical protein
MAVLATAVAAGKAAFSLIPKNKEGRQKAAQSLKKGFQWVKSGLAKVQSLQKTKTGYSVQTTDGQTYTASGKMFTASGKADTEATQSELMKYAPYIIGAIVLMQVFKK